MSGRRMIKRRMSRRGMSRRRMDRMGTVSYTHLTLPTRMVV